MNLHKELPSSLHQLEVDMKSCEQTQGQSVYQHGVSVNEYFQDLIGENTLNWKKPKWFEENKLKILDLLYDTEIIERYILYHDCGKPYNKVIYEDGSIHFPDHALVSEKVWNNLFDNKLIGSLIKNDMFFHTCTSKELEEFTKEQDKEFVFVLLVVALCELHSNSNMFGGMDTISFKSKWKKLDRRGNQVCRFFFTST